MTLNDKYHQVENILKNDQDQKHICLFLDFDGVINVFLKEDTERYRKAMEDPDSFDFCEKEPIENLNTLCSQFNIDIVISSTWRFSGLLFCQHYLYYHDFKYTEKVIDTTQMDWQVVREEEILNYLIEHPIYSNYIVLDDLDMPLLNKHLVLTNTFEGFDKEKLEAALQILKKEKQ